ncbi:S41 family peptidase [Flavobacterium azooxidireducens]|uniref:S41 family peptidase n=1 Tax=Flavobacterium azooxidireducens TaxID=1871076 RepID=A0ABY4KB39_9FLAO|nr:S41 family peptidase [Flavobacterium azooxidireducens]UPQ78017.1 S41 family peptidase [Flavobacterium azooxidireducens]
MRLFVKLFLCSVFTLLIFQSCEDMDDKPVPSELEVKDFIWKGLNLYYLWQADQPKLADDLFATQRDLNSFLEGYETPEALFADLKVAPSVDRFSVMFSDYRVLENALQGGFKTNGIEFSLRYKDDTQTDIFGYVRYILPNTSASNQGVTRGMIFYAINNIPMTTSNESLWRAALGQDSYTLQFADYDGGNITPNGISINLIKAQYNENPVYLTNVIEVDDKRIGYLMYNGFFSNYETQLNQAFAQLKAANVTHLVLDLRYNSGGSVDTATRLASMITGQFTGQVFARQVWNQKVMNFFNQQNPEQLINRFTNSIGNGNTINSLNLNKVYVLTTGITASASELIINSLKPYIDVVQIGTITTGKNDGSITLYDSPTFGSNNRNPNHRYAMQPLVLKIADRDGDGEYQNGIEPIPSLIQFEDVANLGVLGDQNEPYLNTAINDILANGRVGNRYIESIDLQVENSKSMRKLSDEMYIEKVPEGLFQILQ